MECLVELVFADGWKLDNDTFKPGLPSTTSENDDEKAVRMHHPNDHYY